VKQRIRLEAVSIILVRSRFPENIGSVARAMKNMGLHRLILVDGCSPLDVNAYKLASGAYDILERAEEFLTLREAISETGCVVGVTSRAGKERNPMLSPEDLMKQLIALSEKNLIAFAFGSEREGLTNEELSLCHLYARLPSSESFPSLNLSQAVMLFCYELFKSSVTVLKPSIQLAKAEQLEKMFEHMEKTLTDIAFLDPHNPKRIMRVLRKIFGRSQMDEREVQILQGIWSQVDRQIKKKGADRLANEGGE
jgi:tRNA/rRNA methyltransferase